jgi:hypothetical protein
MLDKLHNPCRACGLREVMLNRIGENAYNSPDVVPV